MPQEKQLSQEAVAEFLESDDFRRMPPSKKKGLVAYFNEPGRIRRSPPPVPDIGGDFAKKRQKMQQSLDPSYAAKQGFGERVENEDTPAGGKVEQFVVGAARAGKGMLEAGKQAITNPLGIPKSLIQPHIETMQKGKAAKSTLEKVGYGVASNIPIFGPIGAHLGEEVGKGRWAEALGEAAFLWLTDKVTRGSQHEVSGAQRLSAATGALPEHFEVLGKDMAETAKKEGTPKTIGELAENLEQTNKNVTSQTSILLQPVRGNLRLPQEVATKLLQKAQEFDTKTPEGRATRQYLRRRAIDYMKIWKIGELDNKRRQFYNVRMASKSQIGQAAAMKASDEVLADKIIEDNLKEIVYGEMEKAHPRENVRLLKEKESRLMQVREQLKDQIEKLTLEQSRYDAAPMAKKLGMSVMGHMGGLTPRIHGGLGSRGRVLEVAGKQVRRGFPSKMNKLRDLRMKTRVQVIKNFPISALETQSQKPEEK